MPYPGRETEPRAPTDFTTQRYTAITSIGVVPATGGGEERWLAARNTPMTAGSEHKLLLVASGGSIDAYLDGKEIADVKDQTLTQGMIRASGMDSVRISRPEIVHGSMPVSRGLRRPRAR